MCGNGIDPVGIYEMGESNARASGILIDQGHRLIDILFEKQLISKNDRHDSKINNL
jgi:hypothetical protein